MLSVTNCIQDTIHTIHDWSYDLVTTVRANSCSREQLFANGSSYLDNAKKLKTYSWSDEKHFESAKTYCFNLR